jgi:hypothetical protein
MAYTINLTDGTVFATIADGTINQIASGTVGVPLVTLVGKNYAGYGEFLDENFVHLLESGSNTVAPTSPLTGQLWWDKTNGLLKVYYGSNWKPLGSVTTSSGTPPTTSVVSDLWYDSSTQQLKVCTVAGTPGTFVVVGPGYTSAQGTSGAIPETITNSVGDAKYITSLYVNNTRVAVVYNSTQFVPQVSLQTAFPIIYPGLTLSASVTSAVFAGSATNAQLLDNLDSTDFMRATANTATTGRLQVNNANGIYIGTSNVVNISQSSNDGIIASPVSTGNLIIRTNVSGTTYTVATALGANGTFAIANAATVGTTLSVTGNTTGGNLLTGGQVSAAGNVIGANFIGNVIPPAGGAVSTTGNVTGGNILTSGLISAGGNITSGANIAGNYILGNGSQLTGLSAAVSVSQIQNDASNVKIGGANANITMSVNGTANVVVIDATTIYTTTVDVNNITHSGSNAVGNIGAFSGGWFNTAFVTAYQAKYADLAERYASDEPLDPGTVVELGGTHEITRSTQDLSENVFGVISTNAAYLMNGGAGDDNTHPAVAVIGRVPVKVVGAVHKGDRLVSAGNGVARAAQSGEATAFNVIGRALGSKDSQELGLIEATVSIK